MTARTPLETLTLARDYLDSLWAGITPGPWANRLGMSLSTDEPDRMVSFAQMSENKHFILALHATAPAIRELLIDAQIRLTNRIMKDKCLDDRCRPKLQTVAIGIATAILSTPHAAQWITEREAK